MVTTPIRKRYTLRQLLRDTTQKKPKALSKATAGARKGKSIGRKFSVTTLWS